MQKLRRDAVRFGISEGLAALTDAKTASLDQLLDGLEADQDVTDLRHAAYMLATVYHECAGTWRPIEEYGNGAGKPYGKPAANGRIYYGRGYVQLTWGDNYRVMGQALGIDLYDHPEKALIPATAYAIMSRGMRKGMFTGVALHRFIHDDVCDYVNARKIINGLDCAEKIAGYAKIIENVLRGSLDETVA